MAPGMWMGPATHWLKKNRKPTQSGGQRVGVQAQGQHRRGLLSSAPAQQQVQTRAPWGTLEWPPCREGAGGGRGGEKEQRGGAQDSWCQLGSAGYQSSCSHPGTGPGATVMQPLVPPVPGPLALLDTTGELGPSLVGSVGAEGQCWQWALGQVPSPTCLLVALLGPALRGRGHTELLSCALPRLVFRVGRLLLT